MQLFITILHVVLAIFMILIILLQPGKEGGAALAGGSSGNQMYGPRGAGNLLGRATTVVATMFMFTSISLAWYSSDKVQAGSNIDDAIQRLEGTNDDEGFGIPMPSADPSTGSLDLDTEEVGAAEPSEAGEVGTPAGEAGQTTDDAPSPSEPVTE